MKNLSLPALAVVGALLLGACGQSPAPTTQPTPSVNPPSVPNPPGPVNPGPGQPNPNPSQPNPGQPNPGPNVPVAFTFTPVSTDPGALATSQLVTIQGLSGPATLTLTNGPLTNAVLILNGTAVPTPVTVKNGDTVQLQLNAGTQPGDVRSVTVSINGVSGTFSVQLRQNDGGYAFFITPVNPTIYADDPVILSSNLSSEMIEQLGLTFQADCAPIPVARAALKAQGEPPQSCTLEQDGNEATFTARTPGTYTVSLVNGQGLVYGSTIITVLPELPKVEVFQDADFNYDSYVPSTKLRPGTYIGGSSYGPNAFKDNDISSFIIPAGWTVLACDRQPEDAGQGLGCRTYTSDIPYVGDDFNDVISYLKITENQED